MTKRISCLIVLLLITSVLVFAQEENSGTESEKEKIMPLNAGISLSGNLNLYTHDMALGQSIFTENALAYGLEGGAVINIPITRSLFISANAGYHGMLGTSSADDGTELNSLVHYLEIAPAIRYYGLIPSAERFYLTGIAEVSIPLTSTINLAGGGDMELPDAQIRPAIGIGAGYSFKLSEMTYLSPELSFRFPFMEMSGDAGYQSWTVPQIRLGVDLTFSLEKPAPPPAEPEFVPELKTGFKAVNFYENDGTRRSIEKIKVEEIRYSELFPMLPYVFCEKDQSEPSPKYQHSAAKNAAGEFKTEDLKASAVDINKSTLDIIGVRMQKNKNARLTIKGTKDPKTEKDNPNIDKERAERAKSYLVMNYDIPADKITAMGVGEPEKPSSVRVPDGQAENRRIEFYSSNPDLLKPIMVEKDKTRIAEPGYVEFVPFAMSNEEVAEWRFEILQGGKILRKFTGSGTPDSLLWNIFPDELAASEIPVDYRFTAKSESGLESLSDGVIPVEYTEYSRRSTQSRADSTISKFSLVVFDFDSPEISPADQKILLDNVLPAISHKSTVKIYGYSDRIGQEAYNQKLALERAENARKILQDKAPNARYEVYGVGENIEIFDNNSPIGRQLSRTVQIYVVTAD